MHHSGTANAGPRTAKAVAVAAFVLLGCWVFALLVALYLTVAWLMGKI